MVECPACHHIFDTREVEQRARVEQATAAPGEVRCVTRPPAVMPAVEGGPGGHHYSPDPDDHGPNAGDEDETGNG